MGQIGYISEVANKKKQHCNKMVQFDVLLNVAKMYCKIPHNLDYKNRFFPFKNKWHKSCLSSTILCV